MKPTVITPRMELGSLPQTMLAFLKAGRAFALATVIRAHGSTPVKAGAKALIDAEGVIHGTVGGGAVEAEAQRQGRLVVRSGRPVVFDFDLGGISAREAAPICGGSMRLLVAPASAASRACYRRAADALARRACGVWLTTMQQRDRLEVKLRFVLEKDLAAKVPFPEPRQIRACLDQERAEFFPARKSPGACCDGFFVEPVIPPPVLVIVGGGHVGQTVAAQARLLGFDLVVIEDRPEFADGALFPPGTQTHCGPVDAVLAGFPIGKDTFLVLATRGHEQDAIALRACIRRSAAYIGMIGSRRKVPLVRRKFIEAGWATAEEFDRVYAPIGLDLGAVTVPEIAASILAQIISVRRKETAPRIVRAR